MTPQVRIAAQVQPQHTSYAEIRRVCAALEEVGVDVLLTWDHFFPLSGDPDGAHFEAWTQLGAWAEATERVEIGALVTSASYRNPNLLADMARTVDHIPARGGGGELRTLRIVAEHADIWHGFGDAETIAHKHAVLDRWCERVGRDPSEIVRSAGVAPTPGRFAEKVDDYVANAEALYAVGTRLFTIGVGALAFDLGPARDLVAWRDARIGRDAD